jgi:prepilin-type N-terminal cleavage/methylation domain-containing protein
VSSLRGRKVRIVRLRLRARRTQADTRTRGEQGFTLVELLVVVAILPLVVGAISVALLAVFKNETGATNNLTASGDAQVVSANFVGDVQSAQWITTSTSMMCGPSPVGTQLVVSVSPDTPSGSAPLPSQIRNVTSYVELPGGGSNVLFRRICQNGNFSTPTNTAVMARDLSSGLNATITCAPTGASCGAGWIMTPGVQKVFVTLARPTNNNFSLTAVPRAWTNSSGGFGGGPKPFFPFELLGGTSCTPPPTVLSTSGTSQVTSGSGSGFIGILSPCHDSISWGSNQNLSGSIVTADPFGDSYSGHAPAPVESYNPDLKDPFSSLPSPVSTGNPSTSLPSGSCNGHTTCTTGQYTFTSPPGGTAANPTKFDPTTGPSQSPSTFVFDNTVKINGGSYVAFAGDGGGDATKVTYWFRGGLTLAGGANVTFGAATYIFGDSGSNPSSCNTNTTTLSFDGSTIVSASTGLLFYIEEGCASFGSQVSSGLPGSSAYDGIAIWDATSLPLILSAGSNISIGGVYDPNGPVVFSGGATITTTFVIGNSASFGGNTGLSVG